MYLPLDRSQAAQNLWRGRRIGPGHGDVLDILQCLYAVLRSLARNRVADTIFGIEPESWGSLKASAQRDQQILSNVVLRESDYIGLGSVHVDVQFRLIEGLLNAQIRRA